MAKKTASGFAQRLRDLREASGLSQRELAEKAGMHRFGVAKLEQGLREPSWETVRLLSRALGVNCLAFDQGDESLPPETVQEQPTTNQQSEEKKPRAPSKRKAGTAEGKARKKR